MPSRKKLHTEVHTHISCRIEDYRVRATAGVNHYAYHPQYSWRDTLDEPLYKFETYIEMSALCTDPAPRIGDAYKLRIYSDVRPDSSIYWKLKDIQETNDDRVPQYRLYRGKQIPIYKPPMGIGMLEKERGAPGWSGTIWAQPRYLSDLLIVLGHSRQLYLAIHERKVERQRWIQSIAVQTSDAAEE